MGEISQLEKTTKRGQITELIESNFYPQITSYKLQHIEISTQDEWARKIFFLKLREAPICNAQIEATTFLLGLP